jgi:glycosyltransferase involved in cell wall biosynthesis
MEKAPSSGVTVVMDDRLASTMPKVSVCIVTYNQKRFIGDAIESALMQKTTFPYEIIVGDDCSTDGTRDLLRRYQSQHPDRIRLNLLEERDPTEIPAKTNMVTNLESARAPFIALLDGDDYWLSTDKLQKQVALMTDRAAVQLSFHNARIELGEPLRDEGVVGSEKVASGGSITLDERFPEHLSQSGTFTHREMTYWQRDGVPFAVPAASMMFRRRRFVPVPDWFWEMWHADRALQMEVTRTGVAYYHADLYCCRRYTDESMMTQAPSIRRARHRVNEIRLLDERFPGYARYHAGTISASYLWQMRHWLKESDYSRAAKALARSLPHYARFRLQKLRRDLFDAPLTEHDGH